MRTALGEMLDGIPQGKYRIIGFDSSSDQLYNVGKDSDSIRAALMIAERESGVMNIIRIYDSGKKLRACLGNF